MGYSLKHKDTAAQTWRDQIQCHQGTAHKGYNHTEKCTQNKEMVSPTQEHSLMHTHSLTHSQRCGLMIRALITCGSAFHTGQGPGQW